MLNLLIEKDQVPLNKKIWQLKQYKLDISRHFSIDTKKSMFIILNRFEIRKYKWPGISLLDTSSDKTFLLQVSRLELSI